MKKYYLAIIILFLYKITFSQSTNFKIENNNLIWQKIITDTIQINDLYSKIKSSNNINSISLEKNQINFNIEYSTNNLKPYGYKASSYPIYLRHNSNFSGVIEVKLGKYRITINKLNIKSNNVDSDNIITDSLGLYVIKKSKIKDSRNVKKVLKMFNKYFLNTFNFKKNQSTNW